MFDGFPISFQKKVKSSPRPRWSLFRSTLTRPPSTRSRGTRKSSLRPSLVWLEAPWDSSRGFPSWVELRSSSSFSNLSGAWDLPREKRQKDIGDDLIWAWNYLFITLILAVRSADIKIWLLNGIGIFNISYTFLDVNCKPHTTFVIKY